MTIKFDIISIEYSIDDNDAGATCLLFGLKSGPRRNPSYFKSVFAYRSPRKKEKHSPVGPLWSYRAARNQRFHQPSWPKTDLKKLGFGLVSGVGCP